MRDKEREREALIERGDDRESTIRETGSDSDRRSDADSEHGQ